MNRRSCLCFLALAAAGSGPALAGGISAHGGRVGWARLVTPNSNWAIHNDRDPDLAKFIRKETTLNIDPTWYSVLPGNLDGLCKYPFIYAKEFPATIGDFELRNLREYLQRGGFFCVDPCISGYSQDQFLRRQREFFARLIPGCEIRELPDRHPLFHCYFDVTAADLITPDMIRLGASRPSRIGMQGVFQGDRMIAVISVSGLECGWPQTPQRAPGCMKMIVNAYVYAMTRGVETPAAP